ncbi:MAG TPA: hypothetical protein VL357_03070 [Rariglobus sp.]|jgi:hypothetical protein|nr:hypothetical protein [Rariglobus sp.]
MNYPLSIRLRILRTLEAFSPNSAPIASISDGVNIEMPRKVEMPELREHLNWLLEQEMVAKVGEALDPDAARWVITRVGLGAVQQ